MRAKERIAGTNETLPEGFHHAGEDLGGGDVKLAQRIGRAEAANRRIAEERANACIAVCTELATAMGIKRVPLNGGFLFSLKDSQAFLDGGGRLRKVRVELKQV